MTGEVVGVPSDHAERGPAPTSRVVSLPALGSLRLSRPWYLRGPAAWHPRSGRPAAAAPIGAPTV